MVLVVVAIAVGVAVVTVPAMGRGNAGIPRTHIHKEERKGGRARETERKKERKKEIVISLQTHLSSRSFLGSSWQLRVRTRVTSDNCLIAFAANATPTNPVPQAYGQQYACARVQLCAHMHANIQHSAQDFTLMNSSFVAAMYIQLPIEEESKPPTLHA